MVHRQLPCQGETGAPAALTGVRFRETPTRGARKPWAVSCCWEREASHPVSHAGESLTRWGQEGAGPARRGRGWLAGRAGGLDGAAAAELERNGIPGGTSLDAAAAVDRGRHGARRKGAVGALCTTGGSCGEW